MFIVCDCIISISVSLLLTWVCTCIYLFSRKKTYVSWCSDVSWCMIWQTVVSGFLWLGVNLSGNQRLAELRWCTEFFFSKLVDLDMQLCQKRALFSSDFCSFSEPFVNKSLHGAAFRWITSWLKDRAVRRCWNPSTQQIENLDNISWSV